MTTFRQRLVVLVFLIGCAACHKPERTVACGTHGAETKCAVIPAPETADSSGIIVKYDPDSDVCSLSDKKAGTVIAMPCEKLGEYVASHYPTGDARRWDAAQVRVTYRGAAGSCSVALRSSVEEREVPCGDLVGYFRDALKLPSGATYLVGDMGNSHHAEIEELRSKLRQQGYHSVGVLAAVISEPDNP